MFILFYSLRFNIFSYLPNRVLGFHLMGFTTAMSPNRFGSPRFPKGGYFFHLNNNIINEIPNPLSYLGKPSNSNSNNYNTMKLDVDFDDDEYLKSDVDEKPTQKFGSNNSSYSSSSPSQSSVSVNLHRTLSNSHNTKSADEVWKEIVQQNLGNFGEDGESVQMQQQQHTLCDQAFEEYLVHSSAIKSVNNPDIVANHQPLINIDQMVANSQQQPDWLQFQMAPQMGVMGCLPVSGKSFGNQVGDVGYPDNQLSLSVPMPIHVTPSFDSQEVAVKKKRFSDEIMEKTIERRQNRMIKNRESAARSRAKKKAYTNKLEDEVAQLRKRNKILMEEKGFKLN